MLKHLSLEYILGLEQRYRATLINSLGGFKSVNLVGTKNQNGQTNLAVFNSIFHLGASPALVGMIVRPDSVERHTYENILQTGSYTLNHLNEDIYIKAHQTSARYPREISEFTATGLNEEYKDDFFAPYVKESAIKIGVELKEKIELKINGTILVIGAIKEVYLPANALLEDGFVDLEKAGTIASSGLDAYYKTTRLARLSYAKTNSLPHTL